MSSILETPTMYRLARQLQDAVAERSEASESLEAAKRRYADALKALELSYIALQKECGL